MGKKSKKKNKSGKKDTLSVNESPEVAFSGEDTVSGEDTDRKEELTFHKEPTSSEDTFVQMTFTVPIEWKTDYKVYAILREMSMLEVFKQSFELYRRVYPLD